jgi:hypothetical protein
MKNILSVTALTLASFLTTTAWAEGTTTASTDKAGMLQVTNTPDDKTKEPAEKKDTINYLTPSLYGLREILVQYPVFTDPRASNDCGVNREPLLTVMQRNLQDPNLEIMVLNETHERRGVRAELTYEVQTTKIDQTCISFVNMYFNDRASIILPPLKTARALTITYWQKSMLARSPVDRHQTSVGDALAAMGRNFLREVKLAEPATYSSDQRKPQASEEEEKNERQLQMMRTINDSVSRRLINQGTGADIPAIGNNPVGRDDDHH